ncbi:hypothetical protein [Maritalea porphyrae]|uniref:DUF883 domain-containing protein n=1 Tax=Maritalea porphyrae TaxID=880732 RepID=A0ABQ5UM69_9HYPH|nr:hypothetical protein [Maritalea porphyrae]GLQ15939.1 hypothetical protein GCM10007879_01880 [Maritalea porphyrae]
MATRTSNKRSSNTKNQPDVVENLEKQIESLQSDVHALLKAVNGSDNQPGIVETAQEAIAETSQKTADEAAQELAKVENLIKEQPLKSVAIALGAGAAIALLARG